MAIVSVTSCYIFRIPRKYTHGRSAASPQAITIHCRPFMSVLRARQTVTHTHKSILEMELLVGEELIWLKRLCWRCLWVIDKLPTLKYSSWPSWIEYNIYLLLGWFWACASKSFQRIIFVAFDLNMKSSITGWIRPIDSLVYNTCV